MGQGRIMMQIGCSTFNRSTTMNRWIDIQSLSTGCIMRKLNHSNHNPIVLDAGVWCFLPAQSESCAKR